MENGAKKTKVAIIHYWLVNMRGGEKVLESLLDIFPEADIFTHIYNPKNMSDKIKKHKIYTTFINKLPFAKRFYQYYLPLMPFALKCLDLQNYNLIVSSESGPAKGIVVPSGAYHLCYCHTPMRYLWDLYHEYLKNANILVRVFMRLFVSHLRIFDVLSADSVNCFIANSQFVAKRIRRYYNRNSIVINPPVSIEKYLNTKREPEDFYLFFGQITPYKKCDIAIDACLKLGKKLIIAGSGATKIDIKKHAQNELIKYLGGINDEQIASLFSHAKALLFPGIEDFGIIPVEAMAAGCPVIAYRKGGALETVKENVTGIFFDEQTAESLASAIEKFEAIADTKFGKRAEFNEHVQKFSKKVFNKKIQDVLTNWRVTFSL